MTASQFTIVTPALQDVEAMNTMWAQSWLDTYPTEEFGVSREWVKARVGDGKSKERIEKRQQQIASSKNNPDMLWRIAKNKTGDVIGVVAPYRDEKAQHLGAIYVDKKYHGKGVAGALMKEILAWADPSRPMELEVATYNERAKAFYRKYGFKEVAGSENLVHEVIPVIKMIRKGGGQ